jgi:hypothetical protein
MSPSLRHGYCSACGRTSLLPLRRVLLRPLPFGVLARRRGIDAALQAEVRSTMAETLENRRWVLVLVAILLCAGNVQRANAQGFISPFIGYNFSGDSGCPQITNCEDKHANYGVAFGALGSIVGFEAEFAYTNKELRLPHAGTALMRTILCRLFRISSGSSKEAPASSSQTRPHKVPLRSRRADRVQRRAEKDLPYVPGDSRSGSGSRTMPSNFGS